MFEMDAVIVAPRWMERELAEASDTLRTIYGLEVQVETINEDKGRYFIDQNRNQVNGIKLLGYLRVLKDTKLPTVWLTEFDLYINNFNFCFGLAYRNIAIVSLFRLRNQNEKVYISRLRKEISHEVGHLLGLKHCADDKCVMYFSNTIMDTDNKNEHPCSRCKLLLRRLSSGISTHRA